MTLADVHTRFVNAVVVGFVDHYPMQDSPSCTLGDATRWVQEMLLNPDCPREKVEDTAKAIFEGFHSSYATDSKRYRFHLISYQDELLKVMFERSFQWESQSIIR